MTAVEQVLTWIGFSVQSHRTALLDNFDSFDSISEMTEKDITTMTENFSRRTTATERFHIGLTRARRLKNLIHWVHDFARIGEEPSIAGLDQATFRDALQVARQRADIRATESDKADVLSRDASPGKLKSEKDWNVWIAGLRNMLLIIPGVFGVPLVYVIREDEDPDEDEEYVTFVEECIAKFPLEGAYFEADARQVHQLVTSLTQGEMSEEWIKKTRRHRNGRADVLALIDHYSGEGNTKRQIADAEKLRDTLHYKTERALPFATFLARLQKMFTLFEENKEPYQEEAKVRCLFDKISNPYLLGTVAALKASQLRESDPLTFTTAANHLAAQISSAPGASTNISATSTSAEPPKTGIYRDGEIFTGNYPNWKQLSQEEQSKVRVERKRKGVSRPGSSSRSQKKRGGPQKKQIKALKKQLQEQKTMISALSRTRERDDADSDASEEPTHNAGGSFGGRSEKRDTKKKKQRKSE